MQQSAAPTDRPRHNVLVVDDQPVNIQVLYQALAADHRVLKAGSGAEALRVCRTHRPDLVLLDIVMPGMDGFEVCRQLKNDAATRDIPVIFVTAHDDASHETLGLELGAVDFIVKPVNAAVVRARVNTHLGFARSASLLAATLEASADGILVTDLAGAISSMNRAFIQMWNLPPELLGSASDAAVFDCMRAQLLDPELHATEWARTLPRSEPIVPFKALELAGNRHVERYATPLHINGSLRGQVFSFRDVTQRQRAADELVRLNESLESRILQRTEELEQATHQAQAANRAKSDFLSNMSHEIRTPMNAVIGLACLALKADPNPKQRDCLEKIHRSGLHLLGLVNDILDISKIEAGKFVLEAADFQLASVFENVSCLSVDAAKAKGLTLAFEIDPSLSRALRGDALRLGQVVLNYVGNAIKFTRHGQVRVTATTQQRFDAESLIRIEVQDSGIGLSEAQIGQLFQPFQQVDASSTRNHGGTGLGLAICKQLAELMGGEAGVHSRPGQGSVFWFTARMRFGSPVLAEVPSAPALVPIRDAREVIFGARVLLVEDNRVNQEVACGLLEDAGVVVGIANHGQEALDQLRIDRFDCVLMDVQMPVMDGLQATRLIRADPVFAGLPVLAMTANARTEDRARCIAAGMNDFLTKPVLPDRLYGALAHWLTRRGGAAVREHGGNGAMQPSSEACVALPAPAAATAPGDPGVIDLSILSRAVGGDPDKLRRYRALFVDGLPESMAELEAALGQGDQSALADLGHRMKSSARMVGALGLADLCGSLEELRHGARLGEARAVVEKITHWMARLSADNSATPA